MRTIAKHVARKPLVIANATDAQASGRNKQLRERFPARPAGPCWPRTDQTREDTIAWLTSAPCVSENKTTQGARRRGVAKLVDWLSTFPGDTWQQRWELSGVQRHPGTAWTQLPLRWLRDSGQSVSHDAEDLASGLLMLICGDVIRPDMAWMLTRTHRYLALRWRRSGITTGSRGCGSSPRTSRPAPPRTRVWPRPGSRRCWPARAAGSRISPSATAWNWSTPSGECMSVGGRRRSISTCGCVHWASFPTTPHTPSARSDSPPDG